MRQTNLQKIYNSKLELKIKLQMKLLEKDKTNKTKKQLTTSTRRHENGTQKRHKSITMTSHTSIAYRTVELKELSLSSPLNKKEENLIENLVHKKAELQWQWHEPRLGLVGLSQHQHFEPFL